MGSWGANLGRLHVRKTLYHCTIAPAALLLSAGAMVLSYPEFSLQHPSHCCAFAIFPAAVMLRSQVASGHVA